MYISSCDGFVRSAELVSDSRLTCVVEAAASSATTKIYSRTRPAKMLINGQKDKSWDYNDKSKMATVHATGVAKIEVLSQ